MARRKPRAPKTLTDTIGTNNTVVYDRLDGEDSNQRQAIDDGRYSAVTSQQ